MQRRLAFTAALLGFAYTPTLADTLDDIAAKLSNHRPARNPSPPPITHGRPAQSISLADHATNQPKACGNSGVAASTIRPTTTGVSKTATIHDAIFFMVETLI